jgi:tRNA (guanine37-N1)-methyltransferase
MVLQAQPVYDCYLAASGLADAASNSNSAPADACPEDDASGAPGDGSPSAPPPHVIYLSPKGKVLTQKKLCELSQMPHIMLLCGHYEGIDERVLEKIVDEEISIGDYVLTGGELPACVLCDGIIRLLPGVLPSKSAFENESIYSGLLEHPQYTRPAVWQDKAVPDVLLSGHHANIEKWKQEQSLLQTQLKRPELIQLKIER